MLLEPMSAGCNLCCCCCRQSSLRDGLVDANGQPCIGERVLGFLTLGQRDLLHGPQGCIKSTITVSHKERGEIRSKPCEGEINGVVLHRADLATTMDSSLKSI